MTVKDHSYYMKSTKSLFFHLPLHSACCVLLLYFAVLVACCLYRETACLTFEFYLLFMGGGPHQSCVYENLNGIPNVRCLWYDLHSVTLTVFWESKHCLNGTEKGLGQSVAQILTLYTTFEVRIKWICTMEQRASQPSALQGAVTALVLLVRLKAGRNSLRTAGLFVSHRKNH